VPFVAWYASVGRGYLPPLGWAIGTLALAQIAGVMGWADWFPWSVPGAFSMAFSLMYGEQAEQIGLHSYVLVSLAFCWDPPPSPVAERGWRDGDAGLDLSRLGFAWTRPVRRDPGIERAFGGTASGANVRSSPGIVV
jgi:hypothetical protein